MMSVPFFHVGGAIGILGNLYAGNTYVVQPRFDAGEWLRLAQAHRVMSTFVVPTMLQRILDHPDFASTDLSSLAAIAYGAAAAPVALVRRAMAALPHVGFANVFGQTETLAPTRRWRLRIIATRTASGPSACRCPGSTSAWWIPTLASTSSRERLRVVGQHDSPRGEGWLHTGDLARRDADGYIYPMGRLKDTINRGGEKFGPIEVEDAIRTHPAVRDVAVAGIADDEMGQRVGAAVVATSALTLEELRSHCRESIAYFKLPERLKVVDRIPYNDTGKVTDVSSPH